MEIHFDEFAKMISRQIQLELLPQDVNIEDWKIILILDCLYYRFLPLARKIEIVVTNMGSFTCDTHRKQPKKQR